jgi:hypothetical protein
VPKDFRCFDSLGYEVVRPRARDSGRDRYLVDVFRRLEEIRRSVMMIHIMNSSENNLKKRGLRMKLALSK